MAVVGGAGLYSSRTCASIEFAVAARDAVQVTLTDDRDLAIALFREIWLMAVCGLLNFKQGAELGLRKGLSTGFLARKVHIYFHFASISSFFLIVSIFIL